jgi:prolipoprotein diacylglyceryltransferase
MHTHAGEGRIGLSDLLDTHTWLLFQLLALATVAVWLAKDPRDRRGRMLAFAAGVLGAGIGMIALDPLLRFPAWIASGGQGPIFRGAIMSFGALAGFACGFAFASRSLGSRGREALDALAAPLGIAIAFARVGCYTAGCDFGAPTTGPWGVVYGDNTPALAAQRDAGLVSAFAEQALPVHPVQLYEAAIGIVMTIVAIAIRRRVSGLRRGTRFAAVVALYAVGRLGIEALRGDQAATLAGLRITQWLAVAALGWAVLTLVEARTPIASTLDGRASPR